MPQYTYATPTFITNALSIVTYVQLLIKVKAMTYTC